MEENERKEELPNNIEASSQTSPSNKTTVSRLTHEIYSKEKRAAGDSYKYMKEIETLPLRTELLRAQFQEKINQSLNEENKMITTAFIEKKPSNPIKKDFEPRKCTINESTQVDAPDDASTPERHNYFQHSIGNNSKERPLIVNLPNSSTKDKENKEESSLNGGEKIPLSKEKEPPEPDSNKNVSGDHVDGNDNKESEEVEQEEHPCIDCVVTCLYYTHQICDCSIL